MNEQYITVLRLGHRHTRDKRTTSHLALVARAFGAGKLVLASKDIQVKSTVDDITRRFGGRFEVELCEDWRRYLKTWQGTKVHLTMYGEGLERIGAIPKNDDVLVVVGSEKVPREVYEAVDFNISIGHQPHSEIAALALFLHTYLEGRWLDADFEGRVRVLPNARGKTVITYPTPEECLNILSQAGCDEQVIAHVKVVRALALKIAKRSDCDRVLVEAGALLHDIGRAKTHGVAHGHEGGKLASQLNLAQPLVDIIERHVGAGITAAEARELGLSERDYTPQTIEEKIISHADNLIAHDRKQPLAKAIERYVKMGRRDIADKIVALHRELSELYGKDIDEI